MTDHDSRRAQLVSTLSSAEALVVATEIPDEQVISRVVELLGVAERATPSGAGFHAQLDTVAKWVRLLAKPAEHGRFGGSAQVRSHVTMQFRLARAAAEDYLDAQRSS